MWFETPILFIIFHRPNTATRVFAEIKKQKPKRLYIVGDGARDNIKWEQELVNKTRELILNQIDWECDVKTLFREKNLWCKLWMIEGLNWFFENEEMGIILEDDCLPSQSFFPYCENLLNKYKDNEKISIISGHNSQNTWKAENTDYLFSYAGNTWWWASWRNVWEKFDVNMTGIHKKKTLEHFQKLFGKTHGKFRLNILKRTFLPYSFSWDWPFAYSRHMNSSIACVPSKNLIKNIWFWEWATHTEKEQNHVLHKIDFQKRKEPSKIIVDTDYDKCHLEIRRGHIIIYSITRITDFFKITPRAKKVFNKIKKIFGR